MRLAFKPSQNFTSASAFVSPVGRITRAAGLLLYRARNLAASPASTAAFHWSTGTKLVVAGCGGAWPAAHCPYAAGIGPSQAHATMAITKIRRVTLIPR